MNNLSHPNVVQLIGVSAQFRQDNPESFYFGCVINISCSCLNASALMRGALQRQTRKCSACIFLQTFTLWFMYLQDCIGAVQRQYAKGNAKKALFVRGAHGHGPRVRPWHLLRAFYG